MEDLVVPCLSVGWLICSFLSVRIFRGKLRLQIILPLLLLAVFLALGWFLPVAGFFVGIFIFGFKTQEFFWQDHQGKSRLIFA